MAPCSWNDRVSPWGLRLGQPHLDAPVTSGQVKGRQGPQQDHSRATAGPQWGHGGPWQGRGPRSLTSPKPFPWGSLQGLDIVLIYNFKTNVR